MSTESTLINQHVIDPEICIRCNTCEATCPVGAITHDSRNYVVDAEKCNFCMACVPPCPTGSIDNWRKMPKIKADSIDEAQKSAEAQLERFAKGLPVRDAAATAITNRAVVSSYVTADVDPRGWGSGTIP